MKYLLTLSILIILVGCKDAKPSDYSQTSESNIAKTAIATTHPGKKLLETQCYTCHNPTTPEEGRLAPPMVAIKAHYINSFTTKEDFIKSIQSFIDSPTVDKARMRGAVRSFGVMPYQPFNREDIAEIAEYLFEYKIEEPKWFKEHWQKGKKNRSYINSGKEDTGSVPSASKPNFEELGNKYAQETKSVLGKNLMAKIQQSGTEGAVRFCYDKAHILTDSMGKIYNVQIDRVSDKPRNSTNQASKAELIHIENFKTVVASGAAIAPIVKKGDRKVNYYYPITTNTMCLQCHGKPTIDIQPETLSALSELYPKDNATGYGVNEVRGIWRIRFDAEAE